MSDKKVKLIVEVDEALYTGLKKLIKEHTDIDPSLKATLPESYIALANGIPYEAGDCISRSALKEQINTMDFDFGDYYDNTETIIKLVCEKLDNAPTVYDNKAYSEGYNAGVIKGCEKNEQDCREHCPFWKPDGIPTT